MQAEERDTPPKRTRQPLSLRELFCLTTLAAVTVALVTYREWTDHERCLLGWTLGGSLLGIAGARMRGQRSWLAGILGGALGGLIAIGVIAQDWLAQLERLANQSQPSADRLTEFNQQYQATAAATFVVALLLALLAVAAYQVVVWITAGTERGAAATLRRRPYVALTAALAMLFVGCLAWHWERIASPQAWSPRYCIASKRSLSLLIGRLLSDNPPEPQHIALSRDGQWLAVYTDDVRLTGPGDIRQTVLYRLDSQPNRVRFSPFPAERIAHATFSCKSDELAWLELDQEKTVYGDVHVVDLKSFRDTRLTLARDNSYPNSLVWLPDGKLALDRGTSGHVLFQRGENGWSQSTSSAEVHFEPRLGLAQQFGEKDVQVVELESSRQTALLPGAAQWSWPGRSRPPRRQVSANGRFILIGIELHDRELNTVRTWSNESGESELSFHTFTTAGQAVGSGTPHNGPSWTWLAEVPLAHRLCDRLNRPSILLIDPASGVELARTLPLGSGPTDIAFSHDGSRMAVYTWDGVNVYDVPPAFR